jgi:hypothetical protein
MLRSDDMEEWVWWGSDHDGGCEVTLFLLYYLVPAAEEIDLFDHLPREQDEQMRSELYAEVACAGDDELVDPTENADEIAPDLCANPAMSVGQIIGMLEHLLGAEVIDEAAVHEDHDGTD